MIYAEAKCRQMHDRDECGNIMRTNKYIFRLVKLDEKRFSGTIYFNKTEIINMLCYDRLSATEFLERNERRIFGDSN